MKRDWTNILYIKSDIIPVEDLIAYCEDRAAKYEQEFKEYWEDFPDFKANVKGYANVYRNIAGALKHGQSNEGALQCTNCHQPFMPKNANAKFCSTRCRVQYHRKAKSENFIPCDYCKKDPGTKQGSIVWSGFIDKETQQHVCDGCREKHYVEKFKNPEWNGLYSEFPVTIKPNKDE